MCESTSISSNQGQATMTLSTDNVLYLGMSTIQSRLAQVTKGVYLRAASPSPQTRAHLDQSDERTPRILTDKPVDAMSCIDDWRTCKPSENDKGLWK